MVLLPSRGNASTGDMLKAFFEFSAKPENRAAPELHVLRPKDVPVQLALKSLKRTLSCILFISVHFNCKEDADCQRPLAPDQLHAAGLLNFKRGVIRKAADGVRVARMRSSCDANKPELGIQDIDLESTPKLPREGAELEEGAFRRQEASSWA